MKIYLSDSLKIGERRHPAGCVRHPAEHSAKSMSRRLAPPMHAPWATGQDARSTGVRHPAGHVNVWLGLATLWLMLLALGQAAQPATPAQPASQVLWYDQPAGNWDSEALPIGNGRLGAMIFGAADKETVQLNEDSLWEGDEKDTGMYQNLGEFEVALPRAKPTEHYLSLIHI